jgi:hypothetical protein
MDLYRCTCIKSGGGNPVTVYVVGNDYSFAREAALKKIQQIGYCQTEVLHIETIATTKNIGAFAVLALPSE